MSISERKHVSKDDGGSVHRLEVFTGADTVCGVARRYLADAITRIVNGHPTASSTS